MRRAPGLHCMQMWHERDNSVQISNNRNVTCQVRLKKLHILFYTIIWKTCGRSPHTEKKSLQWRHNGRDSISNHQPHDCFINRLFRRRSKKTSKLRVTDLCAGNSPGTGEFPPQMASNAENVSIWWRHHDVWPRLTHQCRVMHINAIN